MTVTSLLECFILTHNNYISNYKIPLHYANCFTKRKSINEKRYFACVVSRISSHAHGNLVCDDATLRALHQTERLQDVIQVSLTMSCFDIRCIVCICFFIKLYSLKLNSIWPVNSICNLLKNSSTISCLLGVRFYSSEKT